MNPNPSRLPLNVEFITGVCSIPGIVLLLIPALLHPWNRSTHYTGPPSTLKTYFKETINYSYELFIKLQSACSNNSRDLCATLGNILPLYTDPNNVVQIHLRKNRPSISKMYPATVFCPTLPVGNICKQFMPSYTLRSNRSILKFNSELMSSFSKYLTCAARIAKLISLYQNTE